MNDLNFRSSSVELPVTNIEAEEAVLGSILLDPTAIYRVAEILTSEAFYVNAHKDIYQACLSLYKNKQSTDALTVINWLADKGKLLAIGGRNKIASLLDRCASSVNVDGLADLLIEKFIRRQLESLSYEVEKLAHDGDTPLSWLLDKIEQKTLFITQLRKQESKGYWNKRDAIVFEQVCKDLEESEEIENAAQRDWVMKKLAKKWKFSNKKELLDFHAKWLDSQNETCTYTAEEYFQKYGNVEQNWLIPGFIAANSVITLYADGGVGKTRLAFTLAKHAVSGGTFAYEGTDFEPMNTLLIETDQGPLNTSKLLEMHDFLEPEVKDRLRICDKWHFGEFGKLKAMLKKHQPKLVILDSLTSLNVESIYSENETEYARPLVRLRHIAAEYNCTFLVIHHCNAAGGLRGSRAIQNTVDEVFKFSRQQNDTGSFNVLTLEKTRSRAPGSYKFIYDEESWGWKFAGRLEDDILGGNQSSTSTMSRCLQFLQKHRGVPFEIQEVAQNLNLREDSTRRDLKRASAEGLVNCGRSSRNRRALVYYMGSRNQLLSDITTDPKVPIRGQTIDRNFLDETERSNQPLDTQLLSNITTDHPIGPTQVLNIVKPHTVADRLIGTFQETPLSVDTKEETLPINGDTPHPIISDRLAENEKETLTFVTEVKEENGSNSTDDMVMQGTKEQPSVTDANLGFKSSIVRIKFASALGEVRAIATPTGNGKYDVQITYPGVEEDDTITIDCADNEKATKFLKRRVGDWRKKLRFSVMQIPRDDSLEYVWIANCKCVDFPAKHRHQSLWVFDTPEGDRIHVGGEDEFKLEIKD